MISVDYDLVRNPYHILDKGSFIHDFYTSDFSLIDSQHSMKSPAYAVLHRYNFDYD